MPSEAAESHTSRHSQTRYQGRNLLFLLLAIGTPAAILYLRIVLGYVSKTPLTPQAGLRLVWASNLALVCFVIAQLISARYVQRFLKPARTSLGLAVQYAGVLLLCGLLSVTGAVLLEGFGYAFFVRLRSTRS